MVGDFIGIEFKLCMSIRRGQALLESNLPAIRLMLKDKKELIDSAPFILYLLALWLNKLIRDYS